METSNSSLSGFPVPPVANCHTFGGLKQEKRILTQFWRLEDHISTFTGSHFLGSLRGEPFLASCSFWWVLSLLGFWLHRSALFLHFTAL